VLRRYALSADVAINLDNFQELQRTADLISSTPELLPTGTGRQQLIGLRINPQVRILLTVQCCPGHVITIFKVVGRQQRDVLDDSKQGLPLSR